MGVLTKLAKSITNVVKNTARARNLAFGNLPTLIRLQFIAIPADSNPKHILVLIVGSRGDEPAAGRGIFPQGSRLPGAVHTLCRHRHHRSQGKMNAHKCGDIFRYFNPKMLSRARLLVSTETMGRLQPAARSSRPCQTFNQVEPVVRIQAIWCGSGSHYLYCMQIRITILICL